MAHDKLLRGRKLVVTFAHQAPIDQGGGPSPYGTMGVKRKGMMETGRPTTLSMLKSGMAGRNDGFVIFIYCSIHNAQIALQYKGQDCDDGGQAATDGKQQAQAHFRTFVHN